MSTTDENTTQDPGPAFNREQFHHLDDLRLSSDDRYIGGVAGGLGRHFRIDPIVIRVVLAALCIFGGIGLLLYAVLWVFVPSDRTGRAMIDLNGPTRRTVLLIFGVIAALAVAGSLVGGFGRGIGWAWGLAGVVGTGAVLLAYLRPDSYRAHRTADVLADTPSAPPVPPTPPHPRRTGLLLFWPTCAAIVIAFGVLGIVAVNHPVAPLWWPGTALVLIGAALVIGAFAGRPGGLIPLGIVTIPFVVAAAIVGPGGWPHHDVTYTPASANAVSDAYAFGTGDATVDLSQVADPNALAGRTITVSMAAGQLTVILPEGVATQVDARLTITGEVEVDDHSQEGFEPSIHEIIDGSAKALDAPLHLIVTGRVGEIHVSTN